MNKKWNQGAAAIALFLVFMAGAFAGSYKPNALDFIAPNCYDGINNDGDSDPFIGQFIDLDDTECIYMPYEAAGWTVGEFDALGFNPPPDYMISAYVDEWANKSDVPTSHYAANKALHEYFGSDVCADGRVQAILTIYRDDYNLPDWQTGVSAHQNDCGVSY
jgi:hypothetical protein